MHSSEFLRDHYYHMENTTLLEVLPWKQDIKQKFLSPFSRILKTCAKNPTALSQSKATSVRPRLILLTRTATRGGCCVCLQVVSAALSPPTNQMHSSSLHSEFWTNTFSRSAAGGWEDQINCSSYQGTFWRLQFAQEAIQMAVPSSLGLFNTDTELYEKAIFKHQIP